MLLLPGSSRRRLRELLGRVRQRSHCWLCPWLQKLTNARILKENMRTGNLPANMKKARVIQIIPYDFNRVILSMKRGQEYTDYINASFIDVSGPGRGVLCEDSCVLHHRLLIHSLSQSERVDMPLETQTISLAELLA